MPTFDASSMILLAASALMGLAIGFAVYALVVSMHPQAEAAVAALGEAQRRGRRPRSAGADRPGRARSLLPVLVLLSRLVPLGSVRVSLAERYARAGWPGGLDDDEVYALSVALGAVIAVVLGLVIALFNPLVAPLGLIGLLVGPGLVSSSLNNQGERRELEISRSMPFVVDLLVLTMRAGAPLPEALERVALDYSGHPIGVEFKSVGTDLELGVTTREAFENLGARVPIPDIKTFVDDLVQAGELGRPVADALERLADRSRIRRVQDATETAGKAMVMVLVPGMLVFLATLIILFSPFIVRYFHGGYTSI
ncbi:MAG: type II secretion system F family protein [Planctomycetota bacterium]|jgi:tight adherence protein C